MGASIGASDFVGPLTNAFFMNFSFASVNLQQPKSMPALNKSILASYDDVVSGFDIMGKILLMIQVVLMKS